MALLLYLLDREGFYRYRYKIRDHWERGNHRSFRIFAEKCGAGG